MASRLEALAKRAVAEADAALERCDLCGTPIAAEHRHLMDLRSRELMCGCRACVLLFDDGGAGAAGGGHFRLVPQRRLALTDFALDDVLWEELRLPVDIAFFFRSSAADRVQAFYPGPMGATESLLVLEAWQELEAANPVLATLADDVEALLVDRARDRRRYWIAPIDDCFALVGLIRTHWRGVTGGSDVWEGIQAFFDDLSRRSAPAGRETAWQT
jgi:Family of unknown function (DUF5947)